MKKYSYDYPKPIYLRVNAETRNWLERKANRKKITIQAVINNIILKAMIEKE